MEQADRDLAARLPLVGANAQVHQKRPVVVGGTNLDGRTKDMTRRARAEADKAEQEAIAARRKNDVEEGRWIDAEEAARAWGRRCPASWRIRRPS
jgi:hypothetical protein